MITPTSIGKSLSTEAPQTGAKPRASTSDTVMTKGAEDRASEAVSFTQMAKSINATLDLAKSMPFDEAKVARIRDQLANGNYPIDNHKVAEKLSGFEALLAL